MQDSAQNVIIRTLPPAGERPPLFIVGDIHGCAHELRLLLADARKRVSDCQIILVGDLFTKGPDPVGVFELIHEYNALAIKGNHDWALISALLHGHRRGPNGLPEHTRQTLHMIRYQRRAMLSYMVNLPHAYTTNVVTARKKWENSYPLAIVHAGIEPNLGLRGTTERIILTARWMRWETLCNGDKRLVLVHSSSRSEATRPHVAGEHEPASHPPRTAEKPEHEQLRIRWHELYEGPELIVFGHDAKQGLFRKTLANGRPICVGLDTGCTYGRALTGYFPDTDDAISVASERTYFDMSRNVIITRYTDSSLRNLEARAQ